jgi:hypothetical protein
MKEKKAIERVITRVCRHVERSTGRAPEGKSLRQIEKKVRSSAALVEKKK